MAAPGTQDDQVDDLALVRAAVDGDRRAARAFHERHASACFRLAMARLRDPAAAEDVVQDAFEAVWRRAAAGPLQGGADGTLRGLLLTITHRRALDVVRSAWSRHRDHHAGVPDRSDPDAAGDPAVAAARREEAERVHRAVGRVPEPYRTVLLLDLAGHDNPTVASLTGRRPNTVAQQRRRGLARLREVLLADAEHEPSTLMLDDGRHPATTTPDREGEEVAPRGG